MIVVSNTSPIISLAAIGQFNLLHHLYKHVHIPQSVLKELNAKGSPWPGSNEVANADWIEVHTVQNQALVTALQRDLDSGESESIALALELHADLVLLDEKEGRRAAQRLDLRISGVVGVLLNAKTSGSIETIQPHLDQLRHIAGFYLSEDLYQHVLVLAGESEG
ncbi:MAG: hypothetical protein MAG431_01845 [Chloroflexi bacterium]|nr:hypothetical protein [Chloroflexota bacterium]